MAIVSVLHLPGKTLVLNIMIKTKMNRMYLLVKSIVQLKPLYVHPKKLLDILRLNFSNLALTLVLNIEDSET